MAEDWDVCDGRFAVARVEGAVLLFGGRNESAVDGPTVELLATAATSLAGSSCSVLSIAGRLNPLGQ